MMRVLVIIVVLVDIVRKDGSPGEAFSFLRAGPRGNCSSCSLIM
jgi:hypothetical protein